MKKISRRSFINSSSVLGMSAVVFGSAPVFGNFRSRGFDLIIKNGNIIDGTGKKEFIADIGIKNGLILKIGNLNEADTDLIINGSSLKISPGFIDIHSHTDTDLIPNPKAESKIRQGVTTEICGADGSSFGPIGGPELERILENHKNFTGEEMNWRTLGGFLDDFSNRKFSVNLATMVGLGTIREFVVGYEDRIATPDEIKRMQYEVTKAIEEGAFGVSSGLEYTPGSFANLEELIALTNAAPNPYRLYATHMRNEDNTVLEAIEESIEVAKRANGRLQISHLKVSGKTNWYKADSALELMDKAISEGLEVHADRYTYVAYHTGLANLFPLWSRDGGTEAFLNRLKKNNLLTQIREFSEAKVNNLDGEWNGVLISSIRGDELKEKYQGKTIKQIGDEFNTDYFETTVNIILESENSVSMVGFGMEESSTEKILAHPRVMISSDAGSHAPYPPMNNSIAHPRAYGTFPRAIAKYVRERKICSLEEMIKKMTSMPAEKVGLKNRGILKEGNAADIVIFNYDKIEDKATFVDSHQYPEGIPYVIVNGKVVIENGEHTGAMPGEVLRS